MEKLTEEQIQMLINVIGGQTPLRCYPNLIHIYVPEIQDFLETMETKANLVEGTIEEK